ncbi:hypothetical protein F0562_023971 [Nyssa sinensis]|uniref:Uncharacterized protein n=1 Tax=Nyssa sinensis TaxID=561372 RepID=A0A5J5BJ63_9ASTE|nr:hypothetical protein F0562_023971 [Nyssa sinensis]
MGHTAPQSWATLFEANRIKENGVQLQHFLDEHMDQEMIFSEQDIAEEVCRWEHALIGYVMSTKLSFKNMLALIRRNWRHIGREGGPWTIDNKPMILKPRSMDFNIENEWVTVVPIWIRFPSLRLHLWSPRALSRMASIVGNPLFADNLIATKETLHYGRLCVEIEVGKELLDHVNIKDFKGNGYSQKIEYKWVPNHCHHCKVFGHRIDQFRIEKKVTERLQMEQDMPSNGSTGTHEGK